MSMHGILIKHMVPSVCSVLDLTIVITQMSRWVFRDRDVLEWPSSVTDK